MFIVYFCHLNIACYCVLFAIHLTIIRNYEHVGMYIVAGFHDVYFFAIITIVCILVIHVPFYVHLNLCLFLMEFSGVFPSFSSMFSFLFAILFVVYFHAHLLNKVEKKKYRKNTYKNSCLSIFFLSCFKYLLFVLLFISFSVGASLLSNFAWLSRQYKF